MDELRLSVDTVFGMDPDRALLIARVPAPEPDWLAEDPSAAASEPPAQESCVLQLAGDTARLKERVPYVLHRAWQSPHGPAYFSANAGQVVVYAQGKWRAEQVADEEEELSQIWGLAGRDEGDDAVFVTGPSRVFMRRAGTWSEIELPEEVTMVTTVAGRKRDEIYIVTEEGILLYDGSAASPVEGPDDLYGLLVRANGDVLATGDEGLHHWSEADQAWSLHRAPAELTIGVLESGSAVLLATLDGVVSWDGRNFAFVAQGFATNFLYAIGDGVFAKGTPSGLWRMRAGIWSEVSLPASLLTGGAHG